jgi:hypothetical protein
MMLGLDRLLTYVRKVEEQGLCSLKEKALKGERDQFFQKKNQLNPVCLHRANPATWKKTLERQIWVKYQKNWLLMCISFN